MVIAYTENQTVKLIRMWQEGSDLNELAVHFNKPVKSIIAKLSKEGVYEAKGYLTKQGLPPESKAAMGTDVEEVLGVRLYQLDKLPKPTLALLREKVLESFGKSMNYDRDISSLQEENRILKDMIYALKDKRKG